MGRPPFIVIIGHGRQQSTVHFAHDFRSQAFVTLHFESKGSPIGYSRVTIFKKKKKLFPKIWGGGIPHMGNITSLLECQCCGVGVSGRGSTFGRRGHAMSFSRGSSSASGPHLSLSFHLWLLEAVACNSGHPWTTALAGRLNQVKVADGSETLSELGLGRASPTACED